MARTRNETAQVASASRTAPRPIGAAIGGFIIAAAGFARMSIARDAGRDRRHAMAFPGTHPEPRHGTRRALA